MTKRETPAERQARNAALDARDFERGREVARRAVEIGDAGGVAMIDGSLRICRARFKAGLLAELLTMAGSTKP